MIKETLQHTLKKQFLWLSPHVLPYTGAGVEAEHEEDGEDEAMAEAVLTTS